MLGSLFPFSQCEIAIFVTFNIFATSVCVKFCSMRKEDLEQNKLYQKQKLEFYAKKASQKKSEPIVAIAWILSVIFLISAFTAPVMLIFSMIGCLFAIGLRVYRKKMYKKYQPMVLFYAAEVVKYEDKINLYNTLISKLTK